MNEFVKFRGLYNDLYKCSHRLDECTNRYFNKEDNFEKSLNEHKMSYLLFEDEKAPTTQTQTNSEMPASNFTRDDAKELQQVIEKLKSVITSVMENLDLGKPNIFYPVPNESLRKMRENLPDVEKITNLALKAEAGDYKELQEELNKCNEQLGKTIKLINAIVSAFASVKDNIIPLVNDIIKNNKMTQEDVQQKSLQLIFQNKPNIQKNIKNLFIKKVEQGAVKSKNFIKKLFNMDESLPFDIKIFADNFMSCKLSQIIAISDNMKKILDNLESISPAIEDGLTGVAELSGTANPSPGKDKDKGEGENIGKSKMSDTGSSDKLSMSKLLKLGNIDDGQIEKFVNLVKNEPIDKKLMHFLTRVENLPEYERNIVRKELMRQISENKKITVHKHNNDEFDRWAILAGIKK